MNLRHRGSVRSEPIIDSDRLSLITRGNDTLARELIGVLLEEAGELAVQLDGHIVRDDRAAISALAHSLKGMAMEVGAARLCTLARGLEKEARPQEWPAYAARLRAELASLRSKSV